VLLYRRRLRRKSLGNKPLDRLPTHFVFFWHIFGIFLSYFCHHLKTRRQTPSLCRPRGTISDRALAWIDISRQAGGMNELVACCFTDKRKTLQGTQRKSFCWSYPFCGLLLEPPRTTPPSGVGARVSGVHEFCERGWRSFEHFMSDTPIDGGGKRTGLKRNWRRSSLYDAWPGIHGINIIEPDGNNVQWSY
jgi:hypothetical protein